MRDQLDLYYLQQPEPIRSCLLAVRDRIISYDAAITEAWKYCTPFFSYQEKNLCYLWKKKKTQQLYLGVVMGKDINHPLLLQESRITSKILVLDPTGDLPWNAIDTILQKSIALCQQ